MHRNMRVIIAGGGPVGLIVALVLARNEVPVTVLEAEPGLTHDLRAGTFHPPTLELLAPLGITAPMLESGIRVPRWQWRDRTAGLIVEWDLGLIAGDTPYPYRLHLEQHRLTPIVLSMLRALPHAEVRFGTRFDGFREHADGIRVEATGTHGPEAIDGTWLVGADGGRSSVRKAAGIEFEGFTWPERFSVISTTCDLARYGYADNAYVADPDQWVAVFRMPDAGPPGLWRMTSPVAEAASESDVLSEGYAQDLLARFLGGGGPFAVTHKSIYSVHQRVARAFRRGRVLLAGDAAHVNNPLGGFGLNSGIHDAVNLGEKLARVMRGEAGADLLDLYERQRRTANLEYVQEISIRNKQNLEVRDPAEKARRAAQLRAVAADARAARDYLLNSSMINSIRRANAIA
ncbi:MAG: FAD-dependent monooxygenase [Burkholderiales bacterium]|nr:FAD-dependent monooxygenase [Burkholderiales bacterium]